MVMITRKLLNNLLAKNMSANGINWIFPPPRKGINGVIDRFVGPGATGAELSLQLAFPILATIAALAYAKTAEYNWSWIQYLVCGVLAFDMSGGITTNSTSAAKRWYHRKGQGFWKHVGFISLHLLHLFVVAWLFLEWNYFWVLISGGYLLIAAVVILGVSPYLQRPIAMIAFSCSLIISLYTLDLPQGLEWFLPLFYLKLLVCHLVREEPYQPTKIC